MTPEETRKRAAEKARLWRITNPEKSRAATARYRATHLEAERKRKRDYQHEHKAEQRVRQQAHPEKGRRRVMKWLSNPSNRIKARLTSARWRARKRGLAFDEALFAYAGNPPIHCACCKHPLDYAGKERGGTRGRGLSIDRVDNTKGYTVNNVSFICHRCNALKSDATVDELLAIVAYMQRHAANAHQQ